MYGAIIKISKLNLYKNILQHQRFIMCESQSNIVCSQAPVVSCVQNVETDNFKTIFKNLKRKVPPPDYSDVIDFDKINCNNNSVRLIAPNSEKLLSLGQNNLDKLNLIPYNSWKIYTVESVPGLNFISNPFTPSGQRFWIQKCLQNYPEYPNLTNLHGDLQNPPDTKYRHLWEGFKTNPSRNEMVNLRWSTLGYHHNWDTKVYSLERKTEFPHCLSELVKHVAVGLGFEKYQPEAAIVNYYNLNSTLSGHTDHSEIDCAAPLFSFSFGQTAIFMIGGLTKATVPISMYLKSGDIVVMTGHSRLCYHGVPKILGLKNESDWLKIFDECSISAEQEKLKMYLEFSRININVRQVFPYS